jgi:hypothetical protein
MDMDSGTDGGTVPFVMARCSGVPGGFCPCAGADDGVTHYLFCPDVVTWDRARDLCHTFGAELVKIESAEEQHFVWTSAITVLGAEDYWVGLSDATAEGAWTWSDGTALGAYGGWAYGQPDSGGPTKIPMDEDCVELNAMQDGSWNDLSCMVGYLDYICEAPL